MLQRELAQHGLALGGQAHAHLPAVGRGVAAPHKSVGCQPVDQSHHAVMPQLQALRQIADRGRAFVRLHGQKQLMLHRFQAGPPRRLLAELQEAADLKTEFGQCPVIGRAQCCRDGVPSYKYRITIYCVGQTIVFCGLPVCPTSHRLQLG